MLTPSKAVPSDHRTRRTFEYDIRQCNIERQQGRQHVAITPSLPLRNRSIWTDTHIYDPVRACQHKQSLPYTTMTGNTTHTHGQYRVVHVQDINTASGRIYIYARQRRDLIKPARALMHQATKDYNSVASAIRTIA